VRDPARTIPRAVIWSVVIVAALYMTMNVCIIAVVPWQEAMQSENIGSLFMERLYGRPVAVIFTGFIIWTSVASVLAITLAYSRIPYAAARAGDFFASFGKLDRRGHYPKVSLLAISGVTVVFCFFPLGQVIDAAVTIRILVQFVGQIVALHLLRKSRPDRAAAVPHVALPVPGAGGAGRLGLHVGDVWRGFGLLGAGRHRFGGRGFPDLAMAGAAAK
jgi:amino acid transporter